MLGGGQKISTSFSQRAMLTAGLVAVVGPAILAYKVEDALVDRLGAPE